MTIKKAPTLIALPFLGGGLAIILIGLGVIPVAPESLHAPGWVLAFAGIPFVAVGLFILSQNVEALSWFQNCAGLIIFTCFAVIADWVAFGPGEREFEGNIPALGGEAIGRVVFGIGGAFLTVISAIGWYRMAKYWITGEKSW